MEVLNVFAGEWDEWPSPRPHDRTWRWRPVGRRLGGAMLGASLYELPPRQRMFPYHWHAANEELLVVLDGRAVLRARRRARRRPRRRGRLPAGTGRRAPAAERL